MDPDAPMSLADLEAEQVAAEAEEMLDKEAFWVVFKSMFSIPGTLSKDFAPLAIADAEQHQARAASDAVHSLLEIYYPAALMPQSETLGHLMVAGPFFIGKAMIVREMIRARNAPPPPKKVEEKQEAAPEPLPPKGDDNVFRATAKWGTGE